MGTRAARGTVESAGPVKPALELLEPDPDDSRLATVGDTLAVWSRGELLTFAVRAPGPTAPELFGTVRGPLRPLSAELWAARVELPRLQDACIEYHLVEGAELAQRHSGVWRGSAAPKAAAKQDAVVGPAVVLNAADTEIAQRHRVRLWSPPKPVALMLCADGDGISGWASVIAAARLPVALVGIESAGRSIKPGTAGHDPTRDPRACAYLPYTDPPYFARHMAYAIDAVLPWSQAQLSEQAHVGALPLLVFGVSNGAVFAASAAALHSRLFAGALAFSLGVPPAVTVARRGIPHALVAGELEPGFKRETTRYARRLRARRMPVRLVLPLRGHDHSMWQDELVPALTWMLAELQGACCG